MLIYTHDQEKAFSSKFHIKNEDDIRYQINIFIIKIRNV